MPQPIRRPPTPSRPASAPLAGLASREPVTVSLRFPVEAHGETIDAITFRRPTGGDLIACDGLGEIAMSAKLIERCGNVPPSTIKALDALDFGACAEAVAGFFVSFPATGGV